MYLAKYKINMFSSEARRAVADRQNLHSLIQKMFNTDRKTSDVLYALNGNALYISAGKKPEQVEGVTFEFGRDMPIADNGAMMHFSLTTLPRKTVNGHRMILRTEEERLEWLNRQAERNGFRIISVVEIGKEPICSRRKQFDVTAFKYRGTLMVTDAVAFENARLKGIGSMKAYGCGMLLVA